MGVSVRAGTRRGPRQGTGGRPGPRCEAGPDCALSLALAGSPNAVYHTASIRPATRFWQSGLSPGRTPLTLAAETLAMSLLLGVDPLRRRRSPFSLTTVTTSWLRGPLPTLNAEAAVEGGGLAVWREASAGDPGRTRPSNRFRHDDGRADDPDARAGALRRRRCRLAPREALGRRGGGEPRIGASPGAAGAQRSPHGVARSMF